jgi:hypothetical protein
MQQTPRQDAAAQRRGWQAALSWLERRDQLVGDMGRAPSLARPGGPAAWPAAAKPSTDAAPRLRCPDRRTIAPIHHDTVRIVFALPDAATELRLVSRAGVPGEARPWLDDQRRLGLSLHHHTPGLNT